MADMKEIQQKTALYKIRKARGMSQKQLAEAVNASNQQISCLENGDRKLAPEWIELAQSAIARFESKRVSPGYDMVTKIADALDCKIVIERKP